MEEEFVHYGEWVEEIRGVLYDQRKGDALYLFPVMNYAVDVYKRKLER